MSQLIGAQNIVCTLPPFLKRGEVNFDYLPQRGKIWKIKKKVEVSCKGRSSWKEGAGTFLIYFFQVL